MPSSRRAIKALLHSLPPLKEGVIYELGSGFGHLAIALAKYLPDRQIVAFEISPVSYLISKILLKSLRLNNLKIIRRDFHTFSLDDASLCVCYLSPKIMAKLENKFRRELREKSAVISHTFQLPHWKAEKQYEIPDLYRTTLYVYSVPSRSLQSSYLSK